ncbi:MAG TPA: hypothetical protein VH165_12915 [Kofleriaceae bacterium]|nr:hypothetical protein [Kofleriaceae bacterium]
MRRHHNPRARLSKRPTPDNLAHPPDLDGPIYLLRDNLGKADAYITAVEKLIELPGGSEVGSSDEPGRHRNHVAHLVESAKLAVRAAACTTEQIDQCRRGA